MTVASAGEDPEAVLLGGALDDEFVSAGEVFEVVGHLRVDTAAPEGARRPPVDLALAIDTSGSTHRVSRSRVDSRWRATGTILGMDDEDVTKPTRREFLAGTVGIAGAVALAACEDDPGDADAGPGDTVAELPTPLRSVDVTNAAELAAALADARPGDHIVLADGRYGDSKLQIRISGTAENPVVIRARNVLGARLPGGFDYAAGTANVWLWGIDLKDATRCNLRGTGHVIRRCRIWPKPRLDGGAVAISPVEGSDGRIDYCELRLHTTAEVEAEFGSTEFASTVYACVRTYNRGDTATWFTGLTVERCLLTGGLSGLPYSRPNQQFVEDDGNPSVTYEANVNWIIANCYGNVECDAAVFDLKVSGMHVYKCHIDGPTTADLQMRQGHDSVVDRVRFCGRISVVNPDKKVLNTSANRIDIMAGNIPYGSIPGTGDRVQPKDTWIINCSGDLKIGFQANSGHTYPALDTLVENHSGTIDRILERRTTINPTIDISGVTPAAPVTMSDSEVGPFAPWVGTEY